MDNTALIIVDVQNDSLPGGALAVTEGDKIIPIINSLQECFDIIIATQDWHPHNHKSFASQNTKNNIGDIIDLNGIQQILWPNHCINNTHGAEFSKDINNNRIDKIIQKGSNTEVDSYSGFFENDKISKTGLDEYLSEKKVNTVYICGLAMDYCVKYTAIDATSLGYKTFLVQDACKGVNINPNDSKNAINDMRENGVTIIDSIDIISK